MLVLFKTQRRSNIVVEYKEREMLHLREMLHWASVGHPNVTFNWIERKLQTFTKFLFIFSCMSKIQSEFFIVERLQ